MNRVRAGKACIHCHQRRVKCDAWQNGVPCSRCQLKGFPDCALIKTRRGTWDRRQRQDLAAVPTSETLEGQTSTQTECALPPEGEGPAVDSHSQSNLESNQTFSSNGNQPLQEGWSPSIPTEPQEQRDGTPSVASADSTKPPCDDGPEHISWARVFDQFEASKISTHPILSGSEITYLGEAFPLIQILDSALKTGRVPVHYAIPNDGSTQRPGRGLQPEELSFCQAKTALDTPERAPLDALVSSFMELVYPMYPVVLGGDFMRRYREGTISLLLLHAVCFASATYCPMVTIFQAGYSDRKSARMAYYKKAEVLYNIGYERNRVVLVQATILLTFVTGEPNSQHMYYDWLSAAVTNAEMLGLHRSTAASKISPRERSLLKRLWWVLVVRDAFCAACMGRTLRADLTQSDVEMLSHEDFGSD
ncbi:uncharacterized protein PV07_04110 [Cladophialophora immunda]|uniref:Zn(2)-C6 fungal-type domain-containing protein n=1 Tax=Cladophialophora immunda TaxID=569365 RepID=A0A0D2CRL7_9EURO|nr:uncharacterized protein PV07_04110 [Cladophialophora immunda]KIW32580.1 hypothetical protein PV07_04110 [Cladophialophora immunda]